METSNVSTKMVLSKWIETHLQLRLKVNKVSSEDMENYAMSLCIFFMLESGREMLAYHSRIKAD